MSFPSSAFPSTLWWLAAIAVAAIAAMVFAVRSRKTSIAGMKPNIRLMSQRLDGRKTPYGNYTSILKAQTVQHYLANGAPPLPWLLGQSDRESMDALSRYFARAIPAPDKDGKVFVMDTLGHGGPQLELFVPVLSSKSPIAVLARSWDVTSQTLDPTLFFFGVVNPALLAIVAKLGFDTHDESTDKTMMIFRNRKQASRRRAS